MHRPLIRYWVLTPIIFRYTCKDVWSREVSCQSMSGYDLWNDILTNPVIPEWNKHSQSCFRTPKNIPVCNIMELTQQESLALPKCLCELYKANQTVWKENSALLYGQNQREDYVWLTEHTSPRNGTIWNDFSLWLEGTGCGQDRKVPNFLEQVTQT